MKLCLQEGDELPRDFTALFDSTLYNLDTSVLPDAIKLVTLYILKITYIVLILSRAYEHLHLKHEPLTLIQPTFETPLPPLNPAVRSNFSLYFACSTWSNRSWEYDTSPY